MNVTAGQVVRQLEDELSRLAKRERALTPYEASCLLDAVTSLWTGSYILALKAIEACQGDVVGYAPGPDAPSGVTVQGIFQSLRDFEKLDALRPADPKRPRW